MRFSNLFKRRKKTSKKSTIDLCWVNSCKLIEDYPKMDTVVYHFIQPHEQDNKIFVMLMGQVVDIIFLDKLTINDYFMQFKSHEKDYTSVEWMNDVKIKSATKMFKEIFPYWKEQKPSGFIILLKIS